jgi:hypothetical protein
MPRAGDGVTTRSDLLDANETNRVADVDRVGLVNNMQVSRLVALVT